MGFNSVFKRLKVISLATFSGKINLPVAAFRLHNYGGNVTANEI